MLQSSIKEKIGQQLTGWENKYEQEFQPFLQFKVQSKLEAIVQKEPIIQLQGTSNNRKNGVIEQPKQHRKISSKQALNVTRTFDSHRRGKEYLKSCLIKKEEMLNKSQKENQLIMRKCSTVDMQRSPLSKNQITIQQIQSKPLQSVDQHASSQMFTGLKLTKMRRRRLYAKTKSQEDYLPDKNNQGFFLIKTKVIPKRLPMPIFSNLFQVKQQESHQNKKYMHFPLFYRESVAEPIKTPTGRQTKKFKTAACLKTYQENQLIQSPFSDSNFLNKYTNR